MNMPYRKKLIEVALPLEAINKESAREKSIRHGHPSTLHLWWARRPLAACRAVLFASLVDDPSAWPELFPSEETQDRERKRLFDIIEYLVKWESSNDQAIILKAQREIARCLSRNLGELMPNDEDVQRYIADKAPPVLDPFCGGGSIPLEAQRLGLRAYASDLNPVAVLITKALIEIPPKFTRMSPVNPESRKISTIDHTWPGATGLAEDVRYYGQWMRDEVEKKIGHLYPKVKITEELAKDRPDLEEYIGKELIVIAWIWARTIPSPNPAINGAPVPLVRSFILSSKIGKEAWVEPIINRDTNTFQFVVRTKNNSSRGPIEGIISRKGGRCLFTGVPMPFAHIRAEAIAGHMGVRMMAIVAEGKNGRVYLSPDNIQTNIAFSAKPKWKPDMDMPKKHRDFKPPIYGMYKFSDLFTSRQLVALTTFSDLINETREKVLADAIASGMLPNDNKRLVNGGMGAEAYADSVATYLGEAISKLSTFNNTLSYWRSKEGKSATGFGRQALAMTWDYTEINPFAGAGGDFLEIATKATPTVLTNALPIGGVGQVKQIDATKIDCDLQVVVSTDPPYYDNISYADLSDYFYVWLRSTLNDIYPDLFNTLLVPKTQELVATPFRFGGDKKQAQHFFEEGLRMTFTRLRKISNNAYPLTVYYAFKQTERDETSDDPDTEFSHDQDNIASTGWETMLEGLIQSKFTITGTWPIRTENKTRILATGSGGTNSLASSIALVCRSLPDDACAATRREFISALKMELPIALHNLKQGNIAPVDLAQASIGPGMAVFTRYTKVMEANGSPMTVRTALTLINHTLDEVLAEQEGEFDADTRWAVAWFDQYGMREGPFGEAETLSRAKDTAINALQKEGIVLAKSGKVQLVPYESLSDDRELLTYKLLSVWEATHLLIKSLETKGESGTAETLQKIGSDMGDKARDLAYRLYSICERKKWSQEALAYNSLIISWPEIINLVKTQTRQDNAQRTLFGEEGS